MEELRNCFSADKLRPERDSLTERRLDDSASLLSVRRLAEKLSRELNFDRLRFASAIPDCPKNLSLPDPSPPSTPSPLCHPVHLYADPDSASASSPPHLPRAPPPPPPPPPPPRPNPNPKPTPTLCLPAIYATVYSPRSSTSSSPPRPSIPRSYLPRSPSPSPCHFSKARTPTSPSSTPPAPQLPSHLYHLSQSALNSLALEDEAEQYESEQKQFPYELADQGKGFLSVPEEGEEEKREITEAATISYLVRLDKRNGDEDAGQPIQYSGGEAKDFIMDRFLPAARAAAAGDAPNGASSESFAAKPPASVARRWQSPSFIEPNIADELDVENRKNYGSQPPVTAVVPPSSKTRGSKSRAACLDQQNYEARKGGLFKSCGFLCLGLKTGVVNAHRRAVASARSVSKPKDRAVSYRSVDDCSERKLKALPSRSVDVVLQGNSTGSDEEEAVVREVKETLQSRRDQRIEHTPSSSLFSGSPRNASFRGSSPRYATSLKDGSLKYGTSSRGSPADDQAGTHFIASPLHGQADVEVDESPQFYDALSRFGSQTSTPVHAASFGNGSPMSPFYEAKGLSGWTQDWTNYGTVSAEETFSHFETPHTSESDDKSLISEFGRGREGWYSPESRGPKSSSLSQRVGKVLRVDTGGNLGMQEMNGSSAYLSGQDRFADDSFLAELEQLLELKNGSFSRLVSSSKPGLVSPILSAKCQNIGNQNGESEKKPLADGMGWPLGISSYHPDSALKPSRLDHKNNTRYVQGANVPSPPLPPPPSGSWLKKAISSNASQSSALAALRTDKAGSAKKKLHFSPTDTAGTRWETMVKSSHVHPGHLRFSEELHHHRPS